MSKLELTKEQLDALRGDELANFINKYQIPSAAVITFLAKLYGITPDALENFLNETEKTSPESVLRDNFELSD